MTRDAINNLLNSRTELLSKKTPTATDTAQLHHINLTLISELPDLLHLITLLEHALKNVSTLVTMSTNALEQS